MITQTNIETPLLAAFPASAAGNITDIRYRIDRIDAGLVNIVPSTNTGVLDLINGGYTVKYTFTDAGSYVIRWEIPNTPYRSSEEIRVDENIYTFIGDKFNQTFPRYFIYGA